MDTATLQRLYDRLIDAANRSYKNSKETKFAALAENWLGKSEGYEMAALYLVSTADIWDQPIETRHTDRWLEVNAARREEADSEAFDSDDSEMEYHDGDE